MPNRLGCLMEMIVGSFPVEDPHTQQRQQRSVVYLCPINFSEPFRPSDHMGPQPVIKVQVREDVIPPMMACSRRVLPCLEDFTEGILGDLQILFSVSIKKKQREKLP